tara:strand:- start:5798 stop:6361 length:564 start_codon:yes stop_codon:yes gene_type:complete
MKSIDPKSLIIGVLSTILIFVLIGAKPQNNNLGDITVNSVKLVDDRGEMASILTTVNGGGSLTMYNFDGQGTSFLGNTPGGRGVLGVTNNGAVETYNTKDEVVVRFGASQGDGAGVIGTFDPNGMVTSILGNSEGRSYLTLYNGGYVATYNDADKQTGFLGTDPENNGRVTIFDRHGKESWSESINK